MGEPASTPSEGADEEVPNSDLLGLTPALFDAIGDGIYRLDADGHFVAANDALTDLTGYSREELLGSHASRLLDEDDAVRAETAVRELLVDGSQDVVRLSIPVRTATGETRRCEVYASAVVEEGEFRGVGGIVRAVEGEATIDVWEPSERRQAFNALAEASADAIVLLDDDSDVRYANPAIERILGYAPESLVGESLLRIVPERLRESHRRAVRRYLETGEKHIDWSYVELPAVHSDGHEVPLAISFGEFEHAGEHYFVGTLRDISERKAVERELERKNERLDQFASMLAHELRNPLQTAQIYLDFVENGDEAAVDQVSDALDRIDELIEVLLVLARSPEEVGGGEAVGLAETAAEAWNSTETDGAELEVDTTRVLRIDPTHLRNLLENLFRNAVQHGGEDVTVRVGDVEGGFYVEDDGPGIPEDEREAVLEAGYTTDSEGIGLGLTFVAQLADAYGWEYTLTDGDEGGVRFEFAGVETVEED